MNVIRLAETVSTNLDARAGRPGDVFVADYQTGGRGRLDHRWQSARGENLMLSAVLDVAGVPATEVPTLTLAAGVAVARAVRALGFAAQVKWPNDVLVAGRKLAGILCERCGDCVIVGLGLNVNQCAFPDDVAARATSLAGLAGHPLDREAVLRGVLSALEATYARWRAGGLAALLADYAALDALKGTCVSVRQTDGDAAPVTGVCGGVRADGALLVGGVPVFAGEAHVERYGGVRDRG